MKDNCLGEKLIALSSAISFKMAQMYSPDELAVIGILFTVLGDQLSLLSSTKSQIDTICDGSKNAC